MVAMLTILGVILMLPLTLPAVIYLLPAQILK